MHVAILGTCVNNHEKRLEALDSLLNLLSTEIENLRKENRKQIEIIRGRFIILFINGLLLY